MTEPFGLSVDWLRFTVPHSTPEAVQQVVGGDWIPLETGFRGYPIAFLHNNGVGVGKIGTGRRGAASEVHCDLSGGIVTQWDYAKLQAVIHWVQDHGGHVGRIDHAFDDRHGVRTVTEIRMAIEAGAVVTRFRGGRYEHGISFSEGNRGGSTVYLGSRYSSSFLRIYDKAAEQQRKGRLVEGPWVRWELVHTNKRANAVATCLAQMPFEQYREYMVGVLRSCVDFRDTTHDATGMARSRAPLSSRWLELTEGFRRAQILIQKLHKSIDDIKEWVARSLAPILCMLCAHPDAGQSWLLNAIQAGADRWRSKHLALLQMRKLMKPYYLKAEVAS